MTRKKRASRSESKGHVGQKKINELIKMEGKYSSVYCLSVSLMLSISRLFGAGSCRS